MTYPTSLQVCNATKSTPRHEHLHEDLGLNVVLPVLPMHGPRARGLPKGAVFPGEDVMDNVHATAQAVWDVRRLLSWIRTQEPAAPIGLNSVSLGGYVASLVASPRRRPTRRGRRPRRTVAADQPVACGAARPIPSDVGGVSNRRARRWQVRVLHKGAPHRGGWRGRIPDDRRWSEPRSAPTLDALVLCRSPVRFRLADQPRRPAAAQSNPRAPVMGEHSRVERDARRASRHR